MQEHDDDSFADNPAERAQAKALREQARAGGLRFEAYLPGDLADWLLERVEQGYFVDPSEAVFAIVKNFIEMEQHRDLRDALLRRILDASIKSGLEDVEAGRTRPADEVFDELRRKDSRTPPRTGALGEDRAMNELIPLPSPSLALPALVASADEAARLRFLEFFAVTIRNPHTRRAYMRASADFLAWVEARGVTSLAGVQPLHVAAWVEALGREVAPPSVKQQIAAVRNLFGWLVTGHIVPVNPAGSVRGPAHSVRRGKTPVLAPDEARRLLDSIDVSAHAGLRDRALIALMVYSFARIGAALSMRVEDVFMQNRRLWVRLHEKGGKRHEMPCHHNLEDYLTAYIDGCALREDRKGPLFRTIARGTKRLSDTPLPQPNAFAMVRRRAGAAEIGTAIGNHSFRATGITTYLKNGGTLETAATMANHSSTRTTQLYDRRPDDVTLDEVERVLI